MSAANLTANISSLAFRVQTNAEMHFHSRYTWIVLIVVTAFPSCIQSPEDKLARYLKQGKAFLSSRDYDRALLAFRNAAKAMPSSAEPQYQAGLTFLEMNQGSNAALAFQAAVQLDRNHKDANLKLAELMIASRDLRTVEEGSKIARQLLVASPDNVGAINATALAELRLGNAAAASEQLKNAIAKHPTHVSVALNLARSLASQHDSAGAERALLDGIKASPKSVELLLALGDFYLQTKSMDRAEEQYRRALKIEPEHGAAQLAIASIQSKSGRTADAEQTLTKLSNGADKRYRTALAAYLFELGKVDAALADLEKHYRADEDDRQVRNALVNGYLGKGDTTKAEKILAAALAKYGDDLDALQQRGRALLMKGDLERAEADFSRVLRALPNSSETHFLMARVHRGRGSTPGIRQALTEAVRLDPRFLIARLELSQLLREAGSYRTALSLIDETSDEQKSNAGFLLERNWVLFGLGRAAETRPVIEAILKVAQIPEATLQQAALQTETREYAAAQTTLEHALAQMPDDSRVLHLIDAAYRGSNNADGGLKRIQSHVASRPQAPGLKAFLGHLLLSQKKIADARAPLEAAVATAPQMLVAQLDLAEIDTLEGKLDSARQRLQKLIPGDRDGSIHVRLADISQRQGDRTQAIEHYRAAVTLHPNNIVALNNLAYYVADQGNLDEALRYAQQAKELAPNDPAIDDTLGWTYYRKGLYSMAVRHLESAATKQKSALLSYHLSMAYLKSGNRSRGAAMLEAAMRLDPNLPEAGAARQVLSEVRRDNR